jgi:hypothetical protein
MFVIARHPGTEFEQHLLPSRRKWVEPGEGWHYTSMKMAIRAYKKVVDRYPPYKNITEIVRVSAH